MKAITVESIGGPAVLHERTTPQVRPGYMMVRPLAVALNPVDAKVIDLGMVVPGSLLGADYAGVVIAVGEGVDRDFKIGDRVCGCTRYADPNDPNMGTFAERIVVKADLQIHIPDAMSFKDAAAFGVVVMTTGRALFDRMALEYPEAGSKAILDPPSRQIFVYGGSTAMGTMVIQFAKLAGFYVLSTSSPKNKELVESYGADFVVDHYSDTAAAKLIAHIQEKKAKLGPVLHCVDNISNHQSAQFCARVLQEDPKLDIPEPQPPSSFTELMREAHTMTKIKGTEGEKIYSALLPFVPPLPGITTVLTLGFSFLGEPFEQFGVQIPASKADFESSRRFAELAETLIEQTRLRPHPSESREGGLQAIVDSGLQDLRDNKVSGTKLVYPL